MSEYEKMLSGKLYIAKDEYLATLNKKRREIMSKFNDPSNIDIYQKQDLLKDLFKHIGKNSLINYPLYVDYGCHISVGDNFYANFDCIFLDVNEITIGDNVFFGPRVCLYTAGHPIDAEIRNKEVEYALPIKIGNNCWLGGNVIVNPGVTIGDNVVIGSGSVVTKDIPSDVIAVGNPCKVLRKISDEDKKHWQSQYQEYLDNK